MYELMRGPGGGVGGDCCARHAAAAAAHSIGIVETLATTAHSHTYEETLS